METNGFIPALKCWAFAEFPCKNSSSRHGTLEMGGRHKKDTHHDAENITAIKRAIAAGIIHIDTAELYGAFQKC